MDDFGKLILRLALGGLMGFYGVAKAMNFEGSVQFISDLLTAKNLPVEMAYGVFATELLCPLMIILGFWTRLASFGFACGMGFAIYLAKFEQLTDTAQMLNENGGYALELQFLYLFGGLALMFMGPGRIALQPEHGVKVVD